MCFWRICRPFWAYVGVLSSVLSISMGLLFGVSTGLYRALLAYVSGSFDVYSRMNFFEHGTLQHTAAYCNTLQHTSTHGSTLQHTATHCNTLQHTYNFTPAATHCNTLQHNCNYTPALYFKISENPRKVYEQKLNKKIKKLEQQLDDNKKDGIKTPKRKSEENKKNRNQNSHENN